MHRIHWCGTSFLAPVCLVLFHAMGLAQQKQILPLRDLIVARVTIDTNKDQVFGNDKTTVQQALDKLVADYGLRYRINEKAFELAGGKSEDRLTVSLLDDRPLPALDIVRLSEVMDTILKRMGGEAGGAATWLMRNDFIEITTCDAMWDEVYGLAYEGPRFPLVHVAYHKCPLDAALRDIAERTGANVVLDTRVSQKASKTMVSARLDNTPLDTAIRLLTHMADLQTFWIDNVIYVTTRDRAKALAKEQERLIEKGQLSAPRIGNWGGYNGKGPGTP